MMRKEERESDELTYVEEQPESIAEEIPATENGSDDLTGEGEVSTAVPGELENVEDVDTVNKDRRD